MALIKDKICTLGISDELKADILDLFSEVEAKETEVEGLRKRVPSDSQKVVESVDFEKFEAATKELDILKADLQKKLQLETTAEESSGISAAFPQFFL